MTNRPYTAKPDPTRAHAVLVAQLPGEIRWSDSARKTIVDLTPKHMRSNNA